ncbi:MAG: RNA-guided endonuclease TnpB family protein [Coprococcus sp.]
MERGFKYRIYPNESQRDQIARTFGCCRFVYNRALDVKKTAYSETGKSIATNDLIKMIPAWKRDPETSWLAQVDSMALQQSIRDLDRAYKNFFRRVREGGNPGFPSSSRAGTPGSRTAPTAARSSTATISRSLKLGNVRAKVSRPLQGRFMSVTVSLDAAGRYFATFLCTDVPAKEASATDREVGIDLGVETLATLSDGTKIGNPRHLKKYERKLARERRRLSRRKGARRDEKPSDRYLKQRKRVARIHAKIADARTDALHKVTTMLADENQVLCMEDLNAKGMVRNHHLAKAVSDASFGEFARQLEYKCAERGRTLVRVDRFYPSSKTCSACGHRLDALPLSVRSWDCLACGAHHDRDVNAARNILTEGKRILSNTEGTAGHAGTVAATTA